MAIDTKEKRRQALDFAKVRGTGMPTPSGLLSAGMRAHILNLYYEVPSPIQTIFWRNRNLVANSWESRKSPGNSWGARQTPNSSWRGRTPPPDGATQTI